MHNRITLSMTTEQAQVVVKALDLYTRLGLGQITEIEHLVSEGIIPLYSSHNTDVSSISSAKMDTVKESCRQLKALLGYHINGSYGIGHHNVHDNVHKAYEILKVLSKTCAEVKDPNPSFKGSNYEGLIVRYTLDPAPSTSVVEIDDDIEQDQKSKIC